MFHKENEFMAINFMDLLGSMVQSNMASSQKVSNAGSGIQDLLGSLMGAGQSVKEKVGGDNLAAGGIGALLGALMGNSKSTTVNSLGGGMMGLLGMMAYKALTNSMTGSSNTSSTNLPTTTPTTKTYTQPSPQQQNSDAEIIITAMIDAAKSDGQVDAQEFQKITSTLQQNGLGQEGLNYVIKKLQGPMETTKIVAATKGRPDLAAQVYSASVMAIDVDTDAERNYLTKLGKAMGLTSEVMANIEQLTNNSGKDLSC